jgi:class 3 adenylate cyclase
VSATGEVATAASGRVVLPGASDTEVRDVTVLFCDFVGSSALSTRMDAEDFGDVMRRFHESVDAAVRPFGGFVAQLMGDGQLVLFGYPEAHDDSAVQGVRAALAILQAVTSLGAGAQVRIGVHTGPCSVRTIGAGGRQDTLVVGEAANIAARVEAVAEPGTACITAATERLVAGWFDLAALGHFDLKGFADPIAVSRVVGPSGARSRLDARAARGLLPMVGRTEEHAVIRECWNDVLGGHGRVVLIEGEPGIGKSRLVRAIRVDLATIDHSWVEGNCSLTRQNSAFHPIIEAVEDALDIRPEDDVATRLRRLETGIGALGLMSGEPTALFERALATRPPGRIGLGASQRRRSAQQDHRGLHCLARAPQRATAGRRRHRGSAMVRSVHQRTPRPPRWCRRVGQGAGVGHLASRTPVAVDQPTRGDAPAVGIDLPRRRRRPCELCRPEPVGRARNRARRCRSPSISRRGFKS